MSDRCRVENVITGRLQSSIRSTLGRWGKEGPRAKEIGGSTLLPAPVQCVWDDDDVMERRFLFVVFSWIKRGRIAFSIPDRKVSVCIVALDA
mmetsp:Transcript_19061/g.44805  ORF Transcript_19061/g.44805 Transcript_19061/m.44805 type:complete len:92 (+) Transcript_19061:1135-1410(+)